MIIGIDCGCLSITDERLKVGVYRLAVELLTSLSKIDKVNIYKLYSFNPIEEQILRNLGHNFKNIVIKPAKGWFNIWLPLELQKKPVNLFLGLSQSLPKLPKFTRSIVIIHDLTFEKNPEWFKRTYRRMSQNSRKAVTHTDQIVAVSKATKKDIIDIYKINQKKIKVIYPGLSTRFDSIPKDLNYALKKYSLSKPYFLFVGTFKQSKNIPNLLRAFEIFSKINNQYDLILVGSDYWKDPEIERVLNKIKIKSKIKILGFLNDNELGNLYKKAYAFISPSFNEGFGLTFLEAVSFGLPIITSDCGSVRELLGKGAVYCQPSSPEDISRAIVELVNNKNKSKLVNLSRQNIRKFVWSKTAKQLIGLFNNYAK